MITITCLIGEVVGTDAVKLAECVKRWLATGLALPRTASAALTATQPPADNASASATDRRLPRPAKAVIGSPLLFVQRHARRADSAGLGLLAPDPQTVAIVARGAADSQCAQPRSVAHRAIQSAPFTFHTATTSTS